MKLSRHSRIVRPKCSLSEGVYTKLFSPGFHQWPACTTATSFRHLSQSEWKYCPSSSKRVFTILVLRNLYAYLSYLMTFWHRLQLWILTLYIDRNRTRRNNCELSVHDNGILEREENEVGERVCERFEQKSPFPHVLAGSLIGLENLGCKLQPKYYYSIWNLNQFIASNWPNIAILGLFYLASFQIWHT